MHRAHFIVWFSAHTKKFFIKKALKVRANVPQHMILYPVMCNYPFKSKSIEGLTLSATFLQVSTFVIELHNSSRIMWLEVQLETPTETVRHRGQEQQIAAQHWVNLKSAVYCAAVPVFQSVSIRIHFIGQMCTRNLTPFSSVHSLAQTRYRTEHRAKQEKNT